MLHLLTLTSKPCAGTVSVLKVIFSLAYLAQKHSVLSIDAFELCSESLDAAVQSSSFLIRALPLCTSHPALHFLQLKFHIVQELLLTDHMVIKLLNAPHKIAVLRLTARYL